MWARGAEVWKGWAGRRDRVHLVRVREAWRTFPPSDLSGTEAPAGQAEGVAKGYAEWASARGAVEVPEGSAGLPVLLALGRRDEALGRARTAAAQGGSEALNNLGNVLLTTAAVAEARSTYDRALKAGKKDARVHYNAALASLVAGDEAAAADHVFACLDLGADELVEQLTAVGQAAGGARGAAGGGAAALQGALEAAYKRKGRALPDAPRARASKAGAFDATRYLHWL